MGDSDWLRDRSNAEELLDLVTWRVLLPCLFECTEERPEDIEVPGVEFFAFAEIDPLVL
jgi:hypothetical protein